ncbi:hypothetical protein MNAN1_002330 [Malassezia nana]|uniref:Glucose-induced degradation protein 8 n=1 Tax=Malassezia nana TaxID=180528 RepID=A0AAF0EKB9_9BASI|nr:hypothetical protein MNAN1_002330 [Malassezia nana]
MGASSPSWEAKLSSQPISYEDLDRIVFQYLLIHGHEEAAEHLARDAAIRMPRHRHNMRVRSQVREALLHGDVDRAIHIIIDVDPEQILDTSPVLFFELKRLRMVELLRQQQLDEALAFATEHLAPLAEEYPVLLDELEKSMSLCLFDMHMPLPDRAPAYAHQWQDPMHRLYVAEDVNMALLAAQGEPAEAKLSTLLQYAQWGDALVGPGGLGQLDGWPTLSFQGAWPHVPRDEPPAV